MKYGSENIVPYNSEEHKGQQVKEMFNAIAGTYDKLNRILSLGIDSYWRKKAVAYLKPFSPRSILDIATGTGVLAFQMYNRLKPEKIIGADISEGMMEIGRKQAESKGLSGIINFEYQDCCSLTYKDNSFEALTAAFGVRNFEDIRQGLKEMHRVIKPGGHVMILELSTPEKFPMKQLYNIYSKTIIPSIGRLFSKEKAAYIYLPASIKAVPQGEEMRLLLQEAGFIHTQVKTYTFGICSMYTGEKQ